MTQKPIGGAGGGGGKGGGGSARVAREAPDSLRSRAYARVIDLISEGEIQGLATGDLQSVYLDQTPVMNADGTFNFTGITIANRNGTQGQTYIPGFPDVENPHDVSTKVVAATPVIRTITDATYEAARVIVSVPALTSQNTTNGDISGTRVSLTIDVSANGGAYQNKITDTISGKTRSKYQRSYLIELTGSAPWSIRVTRATPDSTTSALQNDLYFDSYTEITHAKLGYPNSAIVASVIDSVQFSSIPTRGFDMKLLRTRIPSNATVNADGSLSYIGSWDGTFQIAWHANPAWAFYDAITQSRYGLGNYISAAQIDKWTLYTIGQYCDTVVPDGFGGYEPRFRCNVYFQTQAEAFKVVQDLATVFCGMVFWSSGLIVPVQDAPADPVAIFTNANVVDGLFQYSGTSLKTRHSVALVTWNDPANFYKQKIEYVEDAAAILRYGVVSTQIVAVGCTSRGQAHRVGRWLLYSEANTTETVSFKSGLESVNVRPGQVINVQDHDRAGVRYGGRITTATTTVINVDATFTFVAGMILYAVLTDGTVTNAPILSVVGKVVTLSSALASAPGVNAVWAVSSPVVALQQFRVVAVVEMGDGTYEISGLQYDANKYAVIETNQTLTPVPISALNNVPDAPSGLILSESLYQTNTDIRVLLEAAWNAADSVSSYIISYFRDNGPLTTVTSIQTPHFEILDARPGLYTVNLIPISTVGKRGPGAIATLQVLGKTAPPADVQNFSLMNISDGVAHLTWSQATDLDVVVGGFVRIRWSPLTTGATWANSVDIGPALAGSATLAATPHVTGTYLAKFVDSSGYVSVNAVTISTNVAQLLALNVVQILTESPTFTGAKSNVILNTSFGGLVLSNATYIDAYLANIDSWDFIDSFGGIAATGTYYFANGYDLGAVYTSILTASITANSFAMTDLIDSKLDNIDDWLNIDGTGIDDCNATLYVRSTSDDPAGSPTWTEWRPFFVGQYVARAFQFQLVLTSGSSTHNICVTALSVVIDMPDTTQGQNGIVSGTGAYAVTFPNAFWVTPAIGITANNMASGDYYTITGQSYSGFTIQFFNASNSGVSRTFDYIAKGQGRKS